jgi:hypothetical protein
MSTARQRISKHASLTIQAVFSAWSMQSGYKERFSCEELVVVRYERVQLKKSSFKPVVKNWVKFWRWLSKVIEKKWQERN